MISTMKLVVLMALAPSLFGCAAEFSTRPLEAKPCELAPEQHHVPSSSFTYFVEAAPGTMLVDCEANADSTATHGGVEGHLPWVGPRRDAWTSFYIPGGGCFQVVECAVDPGPPSVWPAAE